MPKDKFVVKDSGKRQKFKTGMRRDTQDGKPRYDLTVPDEMLVTMLERWAIHVAKGAKKYGERNWEKAKTVVEYIRFRSSAFRHFIDWFRGKRDEDHAAAIFFNVQAAEYTLERMSPAEKKKLRTRFKSKRR